MLREGVMQSDRVSFTRVVSREKEFEFFTRDYFINARKAFLQKCLSCQDFIEQLQQVYIEASPSLQKEFDDESQELYNKYVSMSRKKAFIHGYIVSAPADSICVARCLAVHLNNFIPDIQLHAYYIEARAMFDTISNLRVWQPKNNQIN